ncbi:DNA-binding transcriptional regulator, GntR family [Variovorax sp. NFACC28]|nr:DNA-binding transcriptional regulator, GntR family [Variovorax sp. NFACC28]SEG70137.1 DNA-binding transcriptional regulator, GntR family [Variovorax sp. NFACC29]SFC83200.1 DNA-binding transcriptional regulator, GntR family [Variovorax sp. NFACC26]SFF98042.1 DNA-binding transcriptional regulator, GntR family [Variovorax sp. NFACC27]
MSSVNETAAATELTSLQQRVAREIVALVRRDNRLAGDHLPEIHLAQHIGTSRSPIQVALRHLAQLGVLQQDANRGFFLNVDAKDWDGPVAGLLSTDDPLYLRIVDDRQSDRLTDEVTEADLMRRYGVARSTLRKVLSRISEEGWIEQSMGHGWRFLSMIDSPDAYEESYLFRQSIEPGAILSPSFMSVPAELKQLRREQQRIVDGGFQTMTPIELFEANSHFHETIAQWSHNRFVLQSVRRINQLRRLVEYRQASKRGPRHTHAGEHLAILDAIEKQDFMQAANLMRAHLNDARRNKLRDPSVFSQAA